MKEPKDPTLLIDNVCTTIRKVSTPTEESSRLRSPLRPSVEYISNYNSATQNSTNVGGAVLPPGSSSTVSSSSSSCSSSCSTCSTSTESDSDSSKHSSVYSDSDRDVTNYTVKETMHSRAEFINVSTFKDFSMADFPTAKMCSTETKRQRVTRICGFRGCQMRVYYRRLTLHLQKFHGVDVNTLPSFKCPIWHCGRSMMELSKEFHMKVYHPEEVAKKREEETPVGFKCQVIVSNSYRVQTLIDIKLCDVYRDYRVRYTDLWKLARRRRAKTKQTIGGSEDSTDEEDEHEKYSKLTDEQKAVLRELSEACPDPSLAVRRRAAALMGIPRPVIHAWFYRRKYANPKTKETDKNGSNNLKSFHPHLTVKDKKVLKGLYKRFPWPSPGIRARTARKLGLPGKVVNGWFYRRKRREGAHGSGTSTKPVLDRKMSKMSPGLLLPNPAYSMNRVKQRLTLEDLNCSEDEDQDLDFKFPKPSHS